MTQRQDLAKMIRELRKRGYDELYRRKWYSSIKCSNGMDSESKLFLFDDESTIGQLKKFLEIFNDDDVLELSLYSGYDGSYPEGVLVGAKYLVRENDNGYFERIRRLHKYAFERRVLVVVDGKEYFLEKDVVDQILTRK